MVNNDRSQENSIQQNQDQNLTQFLTLGLNVTGLPCLVVGGGKIGTRKALLLAEKGAPVTILAPEITELAQKKVADGIILWQSSKYARQALQGFFLVVAATNNPKLNLQIGRDAEDLGLLYCITSAGQDSRIIFPAVFEHGQITVAVHSQGQDPQYSVRTRDKISEALTSKSNLKPDQHVSAIPDDQATPDQGKVYIIGAGPGAPDLITLRGLKTIQDANVIIYDRILGRSFVEQLPINFSGKNVDWLGAGKKGPKRQAEINQKMLASHQAGKTVARIKNGDPFVFGRGAEEVQFLIDQNIPWEIIPGISSPLGVLSAAGYPLTCRTIGRSFAVTSARLAGGEFNKSYPKADSLIVLMAIGVLDRVVARLLEDGWPSDTPAVLIERGTLPEERHLAGSLNKIATLADQVHIISPTLLAVGSVATKHLS